MGSKAKDLWGPLRFRYFLSKVDRNNLISPLALDRPWKNKAGDPVPESLDFGAEISRPQAPVGWMPQLRPVFPGAMRFLVSPDDAAKADLPILAPDGKIDRTTLEQFAGMKGTLIMSMVAQSHFDQAAKLAAIPGIEEAPNHAWYGPIQLTSDFLENALLNHTSGLLASHVFEGMTPEVIAPGDPRWPERALRGFLLGNYMPILRAGNLANGSLDDAERLSMPEMVVDPNDASRIALNLAFGWVRKGGPAPATPDPTLVEAIPARLLLQHLSNDIVDIDADPATDHATVNVVFNGHYDAKAWSSQLTVTLGELGFGSLTPGQHPLDHTVREFQIAARGAFVASARPATPPGSERDLAHLVCASNPTPYVGIASGRANQDTRRRIDAWVPARLRNPLLVFPVPMDLVDETTGQPLPGATPLSPDIWLRLDCALPDPRIFAADIAGLASVGAAISITAAEPVGWAQPPAAGNRGGPAGLDSDKKGYVPATSAEVTPEKMLGLSSSILLTPLADPAADLARRQTLSTFKIVRAVAEQECRAYMDDINAYDAGYLSIGIFHWAAAGGFDNPNGGNELGGLIGYLPLFDQARGTHSARAFDESGIASRLGFLPNLNELLGFASKKQTYQVPICFLTDKGVARAARPDDIGEYLPSWRSFYRQIRAGRHDQDLARAIHQIAKRRLRDISRIAFPSGSRPPDARVHPGGVPTIGSVFNSELLIAKILRWHVNVPTAVIRASDPPVPSDYLVRAYQAAAGTVPSAGAAWCDALNLSLENSLDDFIRDKGNDSTGKPKYRRLKTQFADIESPPWIYLAGTIPKTDPNHNPRRYTLDAQLRWLWQSAGSFLLDEDIFEPNSSR